MPYPDNAALRDADREAVGRVQAVRRQHRFPLGLRQIRRELSGDGAGDRQPPRDQDERPLHLRDGPRAVRLEERRAIRRCGATGTNSRSSWRCSAPSAPTPPSRRWRAIFVTDALAKSGKRHGRVRQSRPSRRAALEALPPSPEHMFWFEYNFLYVLAAGGRAEKAALGDHTPAGYQQRARFYAISDEGRLNFSKNIASYIVFLAENTGLATAATCAARAQAPRELHDARRDARRRLQINVDFETTVRPSKPRSSPDRNRFLIRIPMPIPLFHPRRFPPHTKQARELYHRYAEAEPIFDYHCHLPPQQIAANHQFADLSELWLGGDHYKWRAMRTNGVQERFCTGDATPREKFQAWARDRAAHAAQPALPLDAPRAEALLRHRRAAQRASRPRKSGSRRTQAAAEAARRTTCSRCRRSPSSAPPTIPPTRSTSTRRSARAS